MIENLNKRIFVESLYSVLDNKSMNEYKVFPNIYISLVESCDKANYSIEADTQHVM